MARNSKVIDTSAVLGVKIFCPDVPATDLVDQPLTVEAEFAPGARSGQHVHPHQEERYEVLSSVLDVFLDGGSSRSLASGQDPNIMRVTPTEFERIDLRAHSLLADVPLRDVWAVDLRGGDPDRTIMDLRVLLSVQKLTATIRS